MSSMRVEGPKVEFKKKSFCERLTEMFTGPKHESIEVQENLRAFERKKSLTKMKRVNSMTS